MATAVRRRTRARHAAVPGHFAAEASPLGWIALGWNGAAVTQVTIGHRSRRAALDQLGAPATAEEADGFPGEATAAKILRRLVAVAGGADDDLRDVPLATESLPPFARKVLSQCRRIPRGTTQSYGQLAAACGSPGAARAVGRAMATNRFPLIVPCHRVVGANGRLVGFSAPEGIDLKRRLLELEGARG